MFLLLVQPWLSHTAIHPWPSPGSLLIATTRTRDEKGARLGCPKNDGFEGSALTSQRTNSLFEACDFR